MDVIIYHNPACETSRNTLAMIRNAGVEPHIIEYLKCPPTRLLLTQLLARAGLTVRQILREKGTPYHELGLGDPAFRRGFARRDRRASDPDQSPAGRYAEGRPALPPLRKSSRPAAAATWRIHQGRRRARDRRIRPARRDRVTVSLRQRLAAECLGTAFLLATVVGSGIMGASLAGGNIAIALLANTLATGAILTVLILIFGPISGAHMNPAVSLAFALRGELSWRDFLGYLAAQIVGAMVGVWAAHLMFELPVWQVSTHVRSGPSQWFSEGVATFGLLLTIFGCVARTPSATPYAVGLYITAAYWFTASTSFANPAVTIARAFSDTFAGIAPSGVAAFILAQLAGMLAAVALRPRLWRRSAVSVHSVVSTARPLLD